MKKIILGICFSFLALNITAQETEKERRNDIMIDPVLLIAVPAINISYERLLNKDMGVGINALITLNNYDHVQQFSPYFRYYLGRKFASGFFLEGFIPITNNPIDRYETYYDPVFNNTVNRYVGDKKTTTVGFGFGFGGKWAIKDRLVLEASAGIGRRFMSSEQSYGASTDLTGKFMGGVGYRF
jgi:hypothetical protein